MLHLSECRTNRPLAVDRLMSAFMRQIDAEPFNSDSSLHCLATTTQRANSLYGYHQQHNAGPKSKLKFLLHTSPHPCPLPSNFPVPSHFHFTFP